MKPTRWTTMNSDTPTDSENDTMTTDGAAPRLAPDTSRSHTEAPRQGTTYDSARTSSDGILQGVSRRRDGESRVPDDNDLEGPDECETAAALAHDGRVLTWPEFTTTALDLLSRLEDRVLIPVTIGPGTGDPRRAAQEFWADAISILAEDLRNEPAPSPERAGQLVEAFAMVFGYHSRTCRVSVPKRLRHDVAVYAPDDSLLPTVLRIKLRAGSWRVFGVSVSYLGASWALGCGSAAVGLLSAPEPWTYLFTPLLLSVVVGFLFITMWQETPLEEDQRRRHQIAQSQRSENPLYTPTPQRQGTESSRQSTPDTRAAHEDHRQSETSGPTEAGELSPRELAKEAAALFDELELAWLHYLSDTEACVLTKPLLAVDDDPVTAEYLQARFHAKELIDGLPASPSSAQAHQAHAAARAASEAWDRADRHAAEVGLGIFTANERAVLRRIRSLVDTIADQTIQAPARSNYIRQLHTLLGRIASVEGFGAHLSEMPQLAAVAPMLQLAPPARSSRRDPDLSRPEADSRRPSRKDA